MESSLKQKYGFEMQKSLCPEMFDGKKLKLDVREKLLIVAEEFVRRYLKFDREDIVDVRLVGSIVNFNWSKFSDIDVHIVMDFKSFDFDNELLENYFNAKKTVWNDRYEVSVKGHDVELYVEDVDHKINSGGIYSILDDKWIAKPIKADLKINFREALKKAKGIQNIVSAAENGECSSECVEAILRKIFKMRQAGLDAEGERSSENVAFKILRRNGVLNRLFELKNSRFGQELSLERVLEKVSYVLPGLGRKIPKLSQRDPSSFENGRRHLNLVGKGQRKKNLYYNKEKKRKAADTENAARIPELERLRDMKGGVGKTIPPSKAKHIAAIYNMDWDEIERGNEKGVGTAGIFLSKNLNNGSYVLKKKRTGI